MDLLFKHIQPMGGFDTFQSLVDKAPALFQAKDTQDAQEQAIAEGVGQVDKAEAQADQWIEGEQNSDSNDKAKTEQSPPQSLFKQMGIDLDQASKEAKEDQRRRAQYKEENTARAGR